MPDDLRPDEMQDLWRGEPGELFRMPIEDIRRRAQEFEKSMRRGLIGVGALMAGAAGCYAVFLYVFPGMLQRVGVTLTLAAYLYCGYQYRRRGPVRGLLAGAPAAGCEAYRDELRRVRDFPLLSRLMAPFIPGPALFVMSFLLPELGAVPAVIVTTVLIASPFALAAVLIRRKRSLLDREIESLDALMR